MLTSASSIFSLKQWRHVHFSSLYSVLQDFVPSDSVTCMRAPHVLNINRASNTRMLLPKRSGSGLREHKGIVDGDRQLDMAKVPRA
jgi:hypothetical protein